MTDTDFISRDRIVADTAHNFFVEAGAGSGKTTMDLVYRKGGQWHIVDYKTNADPDDLDEKYRAQTDAYLAAFRRTTGCEADARIYHIDVMDCRITPARRQEAIKNADHYRY